MSFQQWSDECFDRNTHHGYQIRNSIESSECGWGALQHNDDSHPNNNESSECGWGALQQNDDPHPMEIFLSDEVLEKVTDILYNMDRTPQEDQWVREIREGYMAELRKGRPATMVYDRISGNYEEEMAIPEWTYLSSPFTQMATRLCVQRFQEHSHNNGLSLCRTWCKRPKSIKQQYCEQQLRWKKQTADICYSPSDDLLRIVLQQDYTKIDESPELLSLIRKRYEEIKEKFVHDKCEQHSEGNMFVHLGASRCYARLYTQGGTEQSKQQVDGGQVTDEKTWRQKMAEQVVDQAKQTQEGSGQVQQQQQQVAGQSKQKVAKQVAGQAKDKMTEQVAGRAKQEEDDEMDIYDDIYDEPTPKQSKQEEVDVLEEL